MVVNKTERQATVYRVSAWPGPGVAGSRLATRLSSAYASRSVEIGVVQSCWESRARYDVRNEHSQRAACCAAGFKYAVSMSSRIPGRRRP